VSKPTDVGDSESQTAVNGHPNSTNPVREGHISSSNKLRVTLLGITHVGLRRSHRCELGLHTPPTVKSSCFVGCHCPNSRCDFVLHTSRVSTLTARYDMPSVCLFVRPSSAGIMSKRLYESIRLISSSGIGL